MSSALSQTNDEGMPAEKGSPGAPAARILLVDDDPVNQMVALGLLRRHGWEAVAAGNGKEALQILANQSFNLVLMDLQMPEMDGFQTATAIRQREAQLPSAPAPAGISEASRERTDLQGSHIPIIALTTASQPGVREKCLAAGMDDYLTKPINPRALYVTVEKHLGSP
jgi:two-component system, sensor histidine kinase and response regulator